MVPIRIRGARQNNLKGLDLDLPKGALIVLSGVSGSGKSSLAFDVLHQEGRRRFAETLDARVRGLVDPQVRPQVETLTGLPPTLAVGQRADSPSGRATVGTLTDLRELLTVLMLRDGEQRCPTCDAQVNAQAADEILAALLALPEGARLTLLAPKVDAERGDHAALLEGLLGEGYLRVRVDGALERIEDMAPLDPNEPHTIEIVVDRLRASAEREARLAEGIRAALRVSDGRLLTLCDGVLQAWATRPWCGTCRRFLPSPEPALLSFASPKGACPECAGLGQLRDARALVLDPEASVREGAVLGLHGVDDTADRLLERLAEALGLDLDAPWQSLSAPHRRLLLEGSDRPIRLQPEEDDPEDRHVVRFAGAAARARLDPRAAGRTCPACDGARLRPEARALRLHGASLPELAAMPLDALRSWLEDHPCSEALTTVGVELERRLDALLRCGLGYLPMDRDASALSVGERRRLRLAALAGSELTGVLFVLDEPTAGLHPSETAQLVELLLSLRDEGNTVLVVEHDPAVIRAADLCLDFGPEAGPGGGRVVFQGTPDALLAADTHTGRWLSGRAQPRPPAQRRPSRHLRLRGARGHNLRHVDVDVPLGALTVVTGPSGAGKSSLVLDTLHRALMRRPLPRPLPHDSLEGAEQIEHIRLVEPLPIGSSALSTPASFTGLWGPLRELLAATREARLQGWSAAHFSLSRPGGRCEACKGAGERAVDLGFLPDLRVPCPVCEGRRFDRATLRVRYRGLNPAELLDTSVEEARRLFAGHPKIERVLRVLVETGLGYLPLGQPSSTLSGGEAQRLRLARDLGRGGDLSRTLYLLDEPATGLHPRDVDSLCALLGRLCDEGAAVIAIEHDPVFINASDYEIALGPGGGAEGGALTYAGPPRPRRP